jgi:co-chaperonin GroES (HSP10)
MKVIGKIKPLRDLVFIQGMNFDSARTSSGLLIPKDDGKVTGIHPRWGQVWAIGPEQQEVKVGEWVLVEHGRWTRTVEVEQDDGTVLEVRMVDNNAIMAVSETLPEGTV